jgi:ketosteroid isomerase-like protein
MFKRRSSKRSRAATAPSDTVVAAVAAMNERDTERLRELTHRDFGTTPSSAFLAGDTGPYSGAGGLPAWLGDIDQQWSAFTLTIGEMRERGDRVAVELVAQATPRRAATAISRQIYVVCEVRGGQLATARSFGGDRMAALKAFNR